MYLGCAGLLFNYNNKHQVLWISKDNMCTYKLLNTLYHFICPCMHTLIYTVLVIMHSCGRTCIVYTCVWGISSTSVSSINNNTFVYLIKHCSCLLLSCVYCVTGGIWLHVICGNSKFFQFYSLQWVRMLVTGTLVRKAPAVNCKHSWLLVVIA